MISPTPIWKVSPDLWAVLNLDGHFEELNPAWGHVLGWSPEEIRTLNFFELIHPDDLQGTYTAFADAHGATPVPRFENRCRCKNGDWRWLSWVAVSTGERVYCTSRDITADKEAHETLVRTEAALRQSQKMESVGQMAGGVAHDFNNLLNGIMSSLEMSRVRFAQGRFSDIEHYLDVAQRAGRRAALLTHRLLSFSRPQAFQPSVVNVNSLLGEMAELIRSTVGPAVRLELVYAPRLRSILVDPPQMENALLNLCINARDAMPNGGELRIETANQWLDESASNDCGLPVGQYLSVCVTDTGIGMSREVIARAFDPFFTTKPSGQGTGLGLAMVSEFARRFGGKGRIHSEVGKGTRVCLYFPKDGNTVEPGSEINTRAC